MTTDTAKLISPNVGWWRNKATFDTAFPQQSGLIVAVVDGATPELTALRAAELVARLGFLPARAQWIAAFREPVIMSTAKARRELRWRPKHDALDTLRQTITAARLDPLIR